jgi:hypothetical protein
VQKGDTASAPVCKFCKWRGTGFGIHWNEGLRCGEGLLGLGAGHLSGLPGQGVSVMGYSALTSKAAPATVPLVLMRRV